jgi:hypothetical protein
MSRKTQKSSDINRSVGQSTRFRAPRELRVVSAVSRKLPVPSIRLSGAWLEQVGFRRGVEFLVVADVPNQVLLVLTDP